MNPPGPCSKGAAYKMYHMSPPFRGSHSKGDRDAQPKMPLGFGLWHPQGDRVWVLRHQMGTTKGRQGEGGNGVVRVWERFLQGNRFSSSAEGLPVTGLRGAYGRGVKNCSQMGPLPAEGCASYQSPLSWGQRARLQSLGNKQEAVASPAALLQLHHPIRAST